MSPPLRSCLAPASNSSFAHPPLRPTLRGPLFDRWIANHHADAPVSSNQQALQIPFQRWFKFKEAFSPQFIADCAASIGKPPRSCIDPFGGSGTSALTAQFLGIRPTTIEVNPFLADLIEAKLTPYDTASLREDYFEVIRASRKLRPSQAHLLKNAPPTLVEPGVDDRWVYPKAVATRILSLREAIALVQSRSNRLLLTVVLGSLLIAHSNVIVNGKGRKYREGWKTRQKRSTDVESAFSESFHAVFSDICVYSNRRIREFTLIRGDSRTALEAVETVDFAILSPPYPNSFDYTDIYNIELWMLGYLTSRADNIRLRSKTLRSHVQIHREFSDETLGSKTLHSAYRDLCRIRETLWNPHIPEMICAYFVDMKNVLERLKARVARGGKVFLAVGNSKYGGVIVDTEAILKELALAHGYRHATSRPIRSMRASAQQGGKRELTEALLTLH